MKPSATLVSASLTLFAGPAQAAPADQYVLSIYGGYRDGGRFAEANTDRALNIDGSTAWSLSLDTPLDDQRQVQVLLARQSTELVDSGPGGARMPLKITYLHLGGTYFFEGERVGQGLFAVGGLGATLFQLDSPGYDNELRPSLNLGVGYQWLLGERFAVRLEGRFYSTLVNSSGGLFCSGGCTLTIKGDTVNQGEVRFGVGLRF